MKRIIIMMMFSSAATAANAVQLNFDGNFIFAENNPAVSNPIRLDDEVKGAFNFNLNAPDDLTVQPETMKVKFYNSFSSTQSLGNAVTANNIELRFVDNFNITEATLKEHGLYDYFNTTAPYAPASNALGAWDVVSLISNFSIPQANGQPDLTGQYTLFGIFNKDTFSVANFNMTDYPKIFDPNLNLAPGFVGFETLTDNHDFHGTAVANAYLISAVPVPAMAWLFGAACLGLLSIRKRAFK